jgi:hypothetical protein
MCVFLFLVPRSVAPFRNLVHWNIVKKLLELGMFFWAFKLLEGVQYKDIGSRIL